MKELTEKQGQVLKFICTCIEEYACPPTVREIAAHFQVSPRAVQLHLEALRKKGFLADSDKRSRSLRVLSSASGAGFAVPAVRQIPLLGTLAAGRPLLCEENCSGYISLPDSYIKDGKSYFALTVRGSSMINAGILDGDTAVIEQAQTARNGQIVVAVLDDAITLKRFFKEKSRIRLQPENPEFNVIYCQNVRIVGVLSCVFRRY